MIKVIQPAPVFYINAKKERRIAVDRDCLTAHEVARVLKCDAQCLRSQIRSDPDSVGFPTTRIKHRIRIPKNPFLAFMGMTEETLIARIEAHDRRIHG